MSEEVRDARTAVPKALLASVTINGILGFGMLIAVLFTIGNITDALSPSTGFVFINYFASALGDNGFATGLTSLLLVLFIFCAVAVLASTSRVTWAFARDNGMPGSFWIKKVCHTTSVSTRALTKKVSPSSHLPIYSIALSAFVSMILSLINIGSSVAFNAIVSLVVAAYFGSYAIPISLVAYKRVRGHPLELGPWNLGRLGLPVNIISLAWLAITWAFSFFPIAVPVVPATMNWSCVLWGFMMLGGLSWYFFYQRYRFTGPTVAVGQLRVH